MIEMCIGFGRLQTNGRMIRNPANLQRLLPPLPLDQHGSIIIYQYSSLYIYMLYVYTMYDYLNIHPLNLP